MMERFFSTLRAELTTLERFPTRQAAGTAVFGFIEVFVIVNSCIRRSAAADFETTHLSRICLLSTFTKPGQVQFARF
jgi:hypothetical protein